LKAGKLGSLEERMQDGWEAMKRKIRKIEELNYEI